MKMFNYLSITFISLIYSSLTLAANTGSIVYGPTAIPPPSTTNSIPTLSETMLIVLGLLLAAVAFRENQKNRSNTPMIMLIGLLGSGAVLYAGGGIKFISDVYAGGNSNTAMIQLSLPGGGIETISDQGDLNIFENTSGVSQKIIQINLPDACPNTNSGLIEGVKQCSDNLVLPTSEQGMCYLDCRPVQQTPTPAG